MNALVGRGGLLDDFFKDINPGFYIRPLHGDPLPTPSQIKVDVAWVFDSRQNGRLCNFVKHDASRLFRIESEHLSQVP